MMHKRESQSSRQSTKREHGLNKTMNSQSVTDQSAYESQSKEGVEARAAERALAGRAFVPMGIHVHTMKAGGESSPPSNMSQTSPASPARTRGGAASHAAREVKTPWIDHAEGVEPRPCPTDAHQATDLESRKPRVPLKEYIQTKKITIKTMTNISIVKRDRMLKSVGRGPAGAFERSQSLSKDSQISPRGRDQKTLGRAREAGTASVESGSPGPSRRRPSRSPSI